MKIEFQGAAGTVTGSRYLLSEGQTHVLVDCGLFQGFKYLRLKNWEEFPLDPTEVSAIILTHAHLDHSGYVPLLVKNGFRGPIFSTSATKDLASLILRDSGFLQKEEANFANKHKFSKHHPALPLYDQKDAEHSIENFQILDWQQKKTIQATTGTRLEFEFHPAGHLLGASSVFMKFDGKTLGFSGDLGRFTDPIMHPPSFPVGVDYLVIESTYGDRQHDTKSPKEQILEIVERTIRRGGTILIPSFSVGRAQLVLYYLHELQKEGRLPEVPIYLNSPMASRANDLLGKHANETRCSQETIKFICSVARAVSSVEESIRLNEDARPKIIIAASGMATGGRVLHHLKTLAPDPRNTLLFVGFQAGGTRGDSLVRGAREVKIHGENWPVRAEVVPLDSMSAHADGNELIEWIQRLHKKPERVFVTHGEPHSADVLRYRIEHELGIEASVPQQGDVFNFEQMRFE
jgi:metallo-beta-lactamase family protein